MTSGTTKRRPSYNVSQPIIVFSQEQVSSQKQKNIQSTATVVSSRGAWMFFSFNNGDDRGDGWSAPLLEQRSDNVHVVAGQVAWVRAIP
jgi:hypothetical protein